MWVYVSFVDESCGGSVIRLSERLLEVRSVGMAPRVARLVAPTGAVPAIKPEVTAIFAPQDGRGKITVSFDGRRFCVPKFRH